MGEGCALCGAYAPLRRPTGHPEQHDVEAQQYARNTQETGVEHTGETGMVGEDEGETRFGLVVGALVACYPLFSSLVAYGRAKILAGFYDVRTLNLTHGVFPITIMFLEYFPHQ